LSYISARLDNKGVDEVSARALGEKAMFLKKEAVLVA